LEPFASFFVSQTRDVLPAFTGHLHGLFQSDCVNLLRMSEIDAIDHQGP
jgi:hypothetical protein